MERAKSLSVAVLFHPFRKLADVIKVISDLHMVVVDISARADLVLVSRIMNLDLAAIGDSEQLLVMTVNETDTSFGFLHVTIQPVFHIAVAIKVVLALIRIQAQKIGIFFGVNADSVVVPLDLHLALRGAVTVACKSLTIMKDVAFFTEGIDDLIKLRFELVGFQIFTLAVPTGKESVTVCVHIGTKITNQTGLSGNLRALPEGVFVFRFDHRSFFKLDHLASSLSLGGFFSCSCISSAFSKPFCAHSGSFSASITPRTSER